MVLIYFHILWNAHDIFESRAESAIFRPEGSEAAEGGTNCTFCPRCEEGLLVLEVESGTTVRKPHFLHWLRSIPLLKFRAESEIWGCRGGKCHFPPTLLNIVFMYADAPSGGKWQLFARGAYDFLCIQGEKWSVSARERVSALFCGRKVATFRPRYIKIFISSFIELRKKKLIHLNSLLDTATV